MKKYHIRAYNMEYFDWENWVDEDWKIKHVILFGNRDMSWNDEDYNLIKNKISDFSYDSNSIENELAYDDIDEDEFEDRLIEFVDYYFKSDERSTSFTKKEIAAIYKLVSNIDEDDAEDIAKLMTYMYGRPYTSGTIHGYSQSDWSKIVYPAEYSQDTVEMIQAVMMGTGQEWMVPDDKTETLEEVDPSDCSSYYTSDGYAPNAKKDLASQIGCSPDEIVLYDENDREID